MMIQAILRVLKRRIGVEKAYLRWVDLVSLSGGTLPLWSLRIAAYCGLVYKLPGKSVIRLHHVGRLTFSRSNYPIMLWLPISLA